MPSHLIASWLPTRCRVVRPPGNLVRGQLFTVWSTVSFTSPLLQAGLVLSGKVAAHWPWPVLKQFKFDYRCRGKSKPGGRVVGSSTRECTRGIFYFWNVRAYFSVRYFRVRFVRCHFSSSFYCYCLVLSLHCEIVSNYHTALDNVVLHSCIVSLCIVSLILCKSNQFFTSCILARERVSK